MKQVFVGVIVIGLGILAWYLNGLLYHSAWIANYAPGQTPEINRGWDILPVAWPLALIGVLVGGGISLPMIWYSYRGADKLARQFEVERRQEEAAEFRAHLKREFEVDRAAIEELKEQSYARIYQADARLKRAEEYDQAVRLREQTLDETVAKIEAEREATRVRARNVNFAYERKVRHANALQTKLNGR